jgi:hypothetical protein
MTSIVLGGCLLLFAAPAPVPDPPKKTEAPPDGVLARTYWQPSAALHRGSRQYVFRDGKALAEAMRVTGASAEEAATAQLAKLLGVKTIDWQKQMVVTIAAGLQGADADRLFITRAVVGDDVLTLYYELRVEEKLQPPAEKDTAPAPQGPAGFGYPAETVLVNRFDGTVRIKDETPAKPAPKKE